MTDDLLARLAALNPDPDPDRFVPIGDVGLPADPELRAILERARLRGDGQRLGSPAHPWETGPETGDGTTRPEGSGRRWRVWAVAAAAVVAIAAIAPQVLPLGGTDPFDTLGTVEVTEPTSTFTGEACIYEGPGTFSLDDKPDFTIRNESDVTAFFNVAEIPDDTTLEELVASYPVIESEYAVPPAPAALLTFRRLEPGEEGLLLVRPHDAGRYGTACVPFDGRPAIPGSVFTVTGPAGTATAPTMTFTGDACTYEGPTAFAVGDELVLTVRNDSEATALLNIGEVPDGSTLEEVVAAYPVIEDPFELPPRPPGILRSQQLPPREQGSFSIRLEDPGRIGTACALFDGSPWFPGAAFTVTE